MNANFLAAQNWMTPPKKFFIGAVKNPLADPFEWWIHRLAKKIKAGVDFIQIQCFYNMVRFREWIKRASLLPRPKVG